MAFLTLEDMTASIECLIFPRVLEQFGEFVATDRLVRISGKLSLREDEEPKLLADALSDISEEPPQVNNVGRGGRRAHKADDQFAPQDMGYFAAPPEDAAALDMASADVQPRAQDAPRARPKRGAYSVSDEVIADAIRLHEDEQIIRKRLEAARKRSSASAPEAKLFIRVNERTQIEDALSLLQSGGDVPVYLHIASENATLLAPRERWISIEADLAALISTLGEANVKLVRKV